MSDARCSRVWEAEAILDGRLGAEARASFERHSATCSECSREAAALVELARLAKELPALETTPLVRRRLRQSLLRRANERAVRSSHRPRHWIAVGAVAAIAFASLGVLRHRSFVAAPPVHAVATPSFETEIEPGTRYRPETLGAHVRVHLDSGRLSVHVAKLRSEQRFVVGLPDGELEVRGTRFTVRVADGSTEGVVVTEGRVALRLRGRPERLISAGEQWQRDLAEAQTAVDPAAPAATASNPSPAKVEETASARTVAAARASAAPPASSVAAFASVTTATAASAAAPPKTARGSDSSPDARTERPGLESNAASAPISAEAPALPNPGEFRAAMQAFSAGDFARADALFAAFIAHRPADARSEDAAFLRAVAHAQRGDATGAAALAREYLVRYPRGFRRSEAEHLARW